MYAHKTNVYVIYWASDGLMDRTIEEIVVFAIGFFFYANLHIQFHFNFITIDAFSIKLDLSLFVIAHIFQDELKNGV